MTNTGGDTKKIYTRQFWLLCLSSLLFFASFNMLIPELPAFLTSLGGAQHKGLIISLFTLTAMISRPFSGKLADKIGRVPVIIFGAGICFLCSLVYPLIVTVAGFLWLRLVHGFSTGFTPTGQSAFLSDIIPVNRRGEAMGLLGTAGSIGMASGPAFGGLIAHAFGINTMFYCTSLLGLFSVAIIAGIKESLPDREKFSFRMLAIKRKDVFEPLVFAPCLVMALSAYAYGTVLTLMPDFGEFVGLSNKGYLFTFLTIASLLIRLFAGKASDRFGRAPVLMIAMVFIIIAMMVVATASSALQLIIGITIYGFGQGATSPTLLAWATDLSSEHHRARGIASVYICMELGIGLGAFISGMMYGNQPANLFITFAVCSALAASALVFLVLNPNQKIK